MRANSSKVKMRRLPSKDPKPRSRGRQSAHFFLAEGPDGGGYGGARAWGGGIVRPAGGRISAPTHVGDYGILSGLPRKTWGRADLLHSGVFRAKPAHTPLTPRSYPAGQRGISGD